MKYPKKDVKEAKVSCYLINCQTINRTLLEKGQKAYRDLKKVGLSPLIVKGFNSPLIINT